MPVYEYFCEACKKDFEAILTLTEHEDAEQHHPDLTCPKCGSTKIHQMAAAFSAMTSKKS